MDIFDKITTEDLSKKSVLVYDRGQFLHIAKRLGRDFGKVYYYLAEEKPYPIKQTNDIGRGFDEFTVVDDFWKALDKSDMVMFCDVYNAGLPEYLKSKGIPVFGSIESERFETDRKELRRMLGFAKLPLAPAVFITGLSKAQEYLKDKKDKYIKTSHYRGDMETYHYRDAFLSSEWFKQKKATLGEAAEAIELMIEDPIDSECEVGFDTPMLDGMLPENVIVGYEAKNKGYASCMMKELPEVLSKVHSRTIPAFKKFGYRGFYSNEIRINKDGKAYYLDCTARFGSPPSELYCEQYSNFSNIVWDLAHGNMPSPIPAKKYGVQLNLCSSWYEHYPLPVRVPKDIDQWVKLKNCRKTPDGYVVIPNDNGEYMGAVIAIDDDLDTAISMCKERAEKITGEEIEYDVNCLDGAIKDGIKAGEKFGIQFS